ncbi:hypothetical protein ACHWQZ_G008295 [Mnemiopsis leidyi]
MTEPPTYLVVLLLVIGSCVDAKEDCVAGDWGDWTTCSGTEVELLQSRGVGKLTRSRLRVSGAHCEKQDLIETKLCMLGETDSDSGSNSSSKDSDSKSDEAEGKGGFAKEAGEGAGAEEGAGEGAGAGVTKGGDASSTSQHVKKDRTERTVLMTLLSVSAALLLAGTVVGTVLIRQHRNLQRRHKVLVMTKERIRLIDGKEVRRSRGGVLCGFEPQFTIHNPMYESEGEEEQWVGASTFTSGHLQLQLS